MPMGRIEIEQLAHNSWIAEIEAKSRSSTNLRAASIEEIIDLCYKEYRKLVPKDAEPPPRVPDQPLTPVEMPASKVVSRQDRNRAALAADLQATENKRITAQNRAAAEEQEHANRAAKAAKGERVGRRRETADAE